MSLLQDISIYLYLSVSLYLCLYHLYLCLSLISIISIIIYIITYIVCTLSVSLTSVYINLYIYIYVQSISVLTSFVVQIFCASDLRFLLSQVKNQRLINVAWWNTCFKWCACHYLEAWIAEDKRFLFFWATFVCLMFLRSRSTSHLLQINSLNKIFINSQSIFILWDTHSRQVNY